jgi:hypothetical protein
MRISPINAGIAIVANCSFEMEQVTVPVFFGELLVCFSIAITSAHSNKIQLHLHLRHSVSIDVVFNFLVSSAHFPNFQSLPIQTGRSQYSKA